MNLFFVIELTVLLLFNILLLNYPLTNTLGFEYSLLNGIVISFLSGLLFLQSLRSSSKINLPLADVYKPVLRADIYFILLPVILSFLTLPFINNCSLPQGILFYICLTLPSVIIGTGIASLSYLISNRNSKTFFVFLFIIILLLPVLELYFYPNIYFYNSILSYYPGTIYDEAIPLDLKLITYKFLNVIFYGGIFFIVNSFLKKGYNIKVSKRVILVLISVFTAVSFIFIKPLLGYSTSIGEMKNELRGVLRTQHFIIYYDKSISRNEIENLGLHHEFYYTEVSSYLKARPDEKITSFIFANPEQKKRLLGSEAADVAKPWLRYIYINYDNYENTLKHEIAHCISADFGVTPFKVANLINPAMIEGIATAADDNFNENTIHYMAGLAYNHGYRFPIAELFKGLNFFGGLSTISYIYSGSFVKYLIDTYGINRFKSVYQSGNFELVYRKNLSQLEAEYLAFIRDFGKNNYHQALYNFGRKPIFKRVCPRFMAEQTEKAWKLYNNSLFDESAESFSKLLKYSDSYNALSGYLNSLLKLKQYSKALYVLRKNISRYENTSYYYTLEFLTAELQGLSRQTGKAELMYKLLNVQFPSRQYEYLSGFRSEIIKDTSLFFSYLSGSNYDKYALLKSFYRDTISYSAVPVMISLSKDLKENYNSFIERFDSVVKANNYSGSYAAFCLSDYSLNNSDYKRAKIFSDASLMFTGDDNYKQVLLENYEKILWFEKFAKAKKMSFIWK